MSCISLRSEYSFSTLPFRSLTKPSKDMVMPAIIFHIKGLYQRRFVQLLQRQDDLSLTVEKQESSLDGGPGQLETQVPGESVLGFERTRRKKPDQVGFWEKVGAALDLELIFHDTQRRFDQLPWCFGSAPSPSDKFHPPRGRGNRHENSSCALICFQASQSDLQHGYGGPFFTYSRLAEQRGGFGLDIALQPIP